MNNKWVKRFFIVTWIPSIVIIIGWIIFNHLPEQKGTPTESEVMVSERLGIKPEWEAIKIYYEGAIRSGMTREEAITVLDSIGPWWSDFDNEYLGLDYELIIKDEPKLVETIYFLDDSTRRKLGTWQIYYEYGVVVSFSERFGI